ncbi:hypothetical protein HNQ34_001295 [Anoxybacillus tepidamans]|uniref:WsbH n=1 Tax=Anoxybacteroides tepidamans TaxID=265948 RepID=A2BD21_9BACL|nr:hypothetical protein [Anoxybacillus tepidamans]ABM68321.1 WsbH [Anoxybacillus tepidamans]MBB5324202.1 hypothetical protein [Anoxybacillus tepidamans]
MSPKILLTTHHLKNFAGSELVIFDLAKFFKDYLCYDVTVISFLFDNPIKQKFIENNITVINVLEGELENKEYDLLWSQHFPTFYYSIYKLGVKADKIIYSSLSPFEPLESIPLIPFNINLYLANSQETRDAMMKQGIDSDKIFIFHNSVSGEYFNVFQKWKQCKLEKICVVSNHIPKEIYDLVTTFENNNVKVDLYGHGHNFTLLTAQKLAEYDLVITIGRTIQMAMAAGIPFYCYDYFGGPGWIDEKNFSRAEYYNFSGRCTGKRRESQEIYRDILQGFEKAFNRREYFYNLASNKYLLDKNIFKVLEKIGLDSSSEVNSEENSLISNITINKYLDVYVRELKKSYLYVECVEENKQLWKRVNHAESMWRRLEREVSLKQKEIEQLTNSVKTLENMLVDYRKKIMSLQSEESKIMSSIFYYLSRRFRKGENKK